jgi:4-methyl-5(b-hydroxyethyl)-thiazole monophosphate biosynthesis
VLGKRGLLCGKRAICYPGFEKYLEGAEIVHTSVVTDGLVTTGIGMGAAVAFGAELVALMKDRQTADAILQAIHA